MASLAPYSITLGATDYPVKYAGLLAYIEPYLTNLETFSFSGTNVGLGVTPSAWNTGYRALDMGSGALMAQASGADVYLTANAFFSTGGSWTYRQTSSAGRYTVVGNVHSWHTAPSGTAGNTISFTQAMTLFASGSLTIGGTNDSARLRVEGTTNLTAGMQLFRSGNACSALWTENGALRFGVDGSTGFTEWMQLTLSGNLGLGVTPSAWGSAQRKALQIGTAALAGISGTEVAEFGSNWYINSSGNATYMTTNVATLYQQAGGVHRWFTAPSGTAGNTISFTQAMTLTAGGAWWLGRTTDLGGAQVLVEGSVADFQSRIRNTSATTPAGLFLHYTAAAPNGTGSLFLRCDDNAATRVEIRSNGGLANFSANNVNLSDARLKTDIELAGDYLAKICAIPVKTFLYRDQQDDERNLGVIAQDVAAVAPELVDHSGFGQAPEGEEPYLAIYQTDLQYALMRAIQELAARVHELERA